MGVQWFVEQAQRVYGPFDAARLKKLAAARKISTESHVGQSKTGPWVKARQVRGLFPDSANGGSEGNAVRQGVPSAHHGSTEGDQKIWLYKHDDEVKGPVSESEMERLVAEKRVAKTTLVLRVGHTHWETAFTAGLFLDAPVQVRSEAKDEGAEIDAAPDAESVLWVGKPAHAANKVFYTLCSIGAPLLLPAWWGLRLFVKTDAARYQVTNRRVRIRTGLFPQQRTDVPLARIRDARLTKPWHLRGTPFCNVELIGEEPSTPLAVLATIPVDESGLVISLCEAGADHQINVQAAQKLLVAAARRERARIQAEMKNHADEIKRLRDELADERKRVREQELTRQQDAVTQPFIMYDDIDGGIGIQGTDGVGTFPSPIPGGPLGGQQPTSKPGTNSTSTALWNVFCRGALSFVPVPPPVTLQRKPASRLTAAAVILGRRRRKTARIKGHYRGKKWIAAHDRELRD